MAIEHDVNHTPKIVTSPITTADNGRDPMRVGPWRLKRAHTESSIHSVRDRRLDDGQDQPSLKAFLKKVDEDCVLIDKLTELEQDVGQRHSDRKSSGRYASTNVPTLTRVGMESLGNRSMFWRGRLTGSAHVILPLALTAIVNIVALVVQIYLYESTEGTRVILSQHAPSVKVVSILLAIMALCTGFAISFAWISAYTISTGRSRRISCIRLSTNVAGAMVVAILFTIWTLLAIVPMLKQQ